MFVWSFKGRSGDEGFLGEFHQGQQASRLHKQTGYKTATTFTVDIKYFLPNREAFI
jgi:hypothetical protein